MSDPNLPISGDKKGGVNLWDIFTYPDLREFEASRPSGEWRRVKGEELVSSFEKEDHILITGTEDSGKSSLIKVLTHDAHRQGYLPLLINAAEVKPKWTSDSLKKFLRKKVSEQYATLSAEEYEQSPKEKKAILVDDLQDCPAGRQKRSEHTKTLAQLFGTVVLVGGDEFCIEELHDINSFAAGLGSYKRFDICEFGHMRMESLVKKWLTVNSADQFNDSRDIDKEARRLCGVVQQVLRTDVIPHHPWILIVLLQQAESADKPAAKNGSYGHLYQAVVTTALATSKLKSFDISAKYTYLGELAFEMFRKQTPILDDNEARAFHQRHCDAFDLTIGYETLRNDLVKTAIVRFDAGHLAFRAKYGYCFFVAWYLAQHIHEDESNEVDPNVWTAIGVD